MCWSLWTSTLTSRGVRVGVGGYNVKFIVRFFMSSRVNSRWSGHLCSSRTSKSTNCRSRTQTWRRRFKTVIQQTPRWRISHSKVFAGIIVFLCANTTWIRNKEVLNDVLFDLHILELKNREKEPTLSCELCGKVDFAYNFKRSKRFCSTVCAKRYWE